MKNITLFVLLIFCLSQISFAQHRSTRDKSFYYEYGKKLYYENHIIPYKNSDSSRVIVLFRIANDQLPWQKSNTSELSKGLFNSLVTVEVEFKDIGGIIRKRVKWDDTVYVSTFKETDSKYKFISGSLSTILENGEYTGKIRVHSRSIPNLKNEKIEKFRATNPFELHSISNPVFSKLFNIDETDVVEPFVLDNNISFSSSGATILLPISYKNDFIKYHYNLTFTSGKKHSFVWPLKVSLSGFVVPLKNKILTFYADNNKDQTFKIKSSEGIPSNGVNKLGLIKIDLAANDIVPGNYKLEVIETGRTDTIEFDFEVIWEDMPLSMFNPEYAAKTMHYILTEDEYDSIIDGDEKEISIKMFNYWQSNDPTPETPYNEAMAEYFMRVDYAFFNYQTLYQKDGAMTERGKIYILHGPPDSTDRKLTDKNVLEVWRYDNLKKEFIFETTGNGKFKLIAIEKFN